MYRKVHPFFIGLFPAPPYGGGARGEAFNAPIVRFTRSAVVTVCVYSSICTVPPIETAEL